MRIAIIETAPFGGLLHYAVQLGDALADRGDEVDLIVTRGNELAGRARAARMRDVLTPPVRSAAPPPEGRAPRLIRRAGVAGRLLRAWSRIVWLVGRGHYDVVIVNCVVDVSVAAGGFLALTMLPGRRVVAIVAHNADLFDRWSGSSIARAPLVRKVLRQAYGRVDLVFLHGERSRTEFGARWPNKRLALIPHGDERLLGEPAPPSPEERILFFGDWNGVKGLPVLMRAFDLVAAKRPEARLTIAGTPRPQEVDVDEIKAWAAGHAGRVELVDHYVPVEQVPVLFGRARAVVTPYLVGYQSGVIHLAMTLARPVVTSDVGDLGCVVTECGAGFVVPPGDPEALAEALVTVISDPALAARLGQAAREGILARAGWDTVAERASGALEEAVGPPAPTR